MDKISKFCGDLQLFHWHLFPLFFWDGPPDSFRYMAGSGEAPSVPMAVPHITAPGQDRNPVAIHNLQPSAIGIHFNQLAVVTNVFDGHSYSFLAYLISAGRPFRSRRENIPVSISGGLVTTLSRITGPVWAVTLRFYCIQLLE